MSNAHLATALRLVLNTVCPSVPDSAISEYIKQELKEVAVAKDWASFIQHITGPAFAQALDAELGNYGVVWQGHAYNFGPLGLTPPTSYTAPEDLNATRKYAMTANFDKAKAITNVLRAIKTAERGSVG